MVTMGYHVGGLMTHFFSVRKNDFIEMALHHLLTLYLFGGCYLYNLWEIGAVIAFLHDIADVTTNIVKTLTETKSTMVLLVVFLTHMSIWFYTRNVGLPYLIYEIIISGIRTRIALEGWAQWSLIAFLEMVLCGSKGCM